MCNLFKDMVTQLNGRNRRGESSKENLRSVTISRDRKQAALKTLRSIVRACDTMQKQHRAIR